MGSGEKKMGASENTCALRFWLKPSVLGNILALFVFFVFLQTTLIDRSLHTSFSFWTYASEVQLSKIQTAETKTCRSTQGGKTFVADDKGYLCLWEKVEDGCCTSVVEEDRFVCGGCNSTLECCLDYELCVSCCLSPHNRPNIVQTIANTELQIFKEVTNSFDFCVSRCRTSSHSLLNHKTYKSPEKHCYGKLVDGSIGFDKLSGPDLKLAEPLTRRHEDTKKKEPVVPVVSAPRTISLPRTTTATTTTTSNKMEAAAAGGREGPKIIDNRMAAINETDDSLLSRVFVRNITHGFGLQIEPSTQDVLFLSLSTAGGQRSGNCCLMSMLITLGLVSYFLSLYSYCSSDQAAWPILSNEKRR